MNPYSHDDRERDAGHVRIEPPRPEEVRAPEESPLTRWASDVGNRAFAGSVSRSPLARDAGQGDGIRDDGTVHPQVQSAIDASRGGGTGLDPATQDRMAPALGDLSDVRVHADETADRLSRSVSARAFATGSDVYFAGGEYNPGTDAGDRLIAHELAHVVQQRGSSPSGPLTVSEPGDALEREADDVADGI